MCNYKLVGVLISIFIVASYSNNYSYSSISNISAYTIDNDKVYSIKTSDDSTTLTEVDIPTGRVISEKKSVLSLFILVN